MSGSTIAAPPFTSDLSERGGTMTQTWADWFVLQVLKRLQQGALVLAHPVDAGGTTTARNQTASIAPTAFNLTSITAGIYRIGWVARVTTAAGTSSSLTVTVSYTRLGVGCTQTSVAVTSNATNLPGSGFFAIHSDGASPISYSTTYASVGVPVMNYELDVTCENIAS